MNKKMNTVLFTIGATIFNLISMLIILLIPLGILLLIFRENLLQAGIFPIVLIILFFGAHLCAASAGKLPVISTRS